jgi:plasmid replication initiation protein
MVAAIQDHMTGVKPIQTDLFNQPMITIDTAEFGEKSKGKYWKAALSLRLKTFEFEYTNRDGKIEDVAGVLVSTVRNVRETSLIHITINQWAIPYLVYIGQGVGFTTFDKTIALTLPGEYTKRMYKLCKRWRDRGGFAMSLDEFRSMLMLEDKYPRTVDLKRWVLEPAKRKMKEGADVYFDYDLSKVGGSRSYNFITFTIKGNNKRLPESKKTDMYILVYNMLTIAYPPLKSSKARDLTDRVADNPRELEKLYSRLKRLKNELDAGEKSLEDVRKLIQFIIREDYENI